jgi:hypothetical protein
MMIHPGAMLSEHCGGTGKCKYGGTGKQNLLHGDLLWKVITTCALAPRASTYAFAIWCHHVASNGFVASRHIKLL